MTFYPCKIVTTIINLQIIPSGSPLFWKQPTPNQQVAEPYPIIYNTSTEKTFIELQPEVQQITIDSTKRNLIAEFEISPAQNEDIGSQKNVDVPPSSKRRKMKKVPLMLPPCSCKKLCINSINTTRREQIHNDFWTLERQFQQEFIF